MAFQPITSNKIYENKIIKDIINWEWNWYYKPILDVFKPNSVLNENNIIFDALKSGALYYQNNAFYSKSGRFSNKISMELEKIGAKYSKYGRCYRLNKDKLPTELNWIIETTNAKVYESAMTAIKILDTAISQIDEKIKEIKITDIAEEMILNVEKKVEENFKANKIQTITPKMSDSIASQFAKEYTETLKYDIKNWQPQNIVKMREVIGQMALKGESRITIQNYIQTRFKVSQQKAKFLTRSESSLAVTEYLSAKYQSEGFSEFIWHAAMDERTRDEHRKLNGKVFRFDNPPIVEVKNKKGKVIRVTQGLPGQIDYGCRCTMTPYISKEFLNNRKIK